MAPVWPCSTFLPLKRNCLPHSSCGPRLWFSYSSGFLNVFHCILWNVWKNLRSLPSSSPRGTSLVFPAFLFFPRSTCRVLFFFAYAFPNRFWAAAFSFGGVPTSFFISAAERASFQVPSRYPLLSFPFSPRLRRFLSLLSFVSFL